MCVFLLCDSDDGRSDKRMRRIGRDTFRPAEPAEVYIVAFTDHRQPTTAANDAGGSYRRRGSVETARVTRRGANKRSKSERGTAPAPYRQCFASDNNSGRRIVSTRIGSYTLVRIARAKRRCVPLILIRINSAARVSWLFRVIFLLSGPVFVRRPREGAGGRFESVVAGRTKNDDGLEKGKKKLKTSGDAPVWRDHLSLGSQSMPWPRERVGFFYF